MIIRVVPTNFERNRWTILKIDDLVSLQEDLWELRLQGTAKMEDGIIAASAVDACARRASGTPDIARRILGLCQFASPMLP